LHLLKQKEHSKKEMAISFGHKKTYRHLDEMDGMGVKA